MFSSNCVSGLTLTGMGAGSTSKPCLRIIHDCAAKTEDRALVLPRRWVTKSAATIRSITGQSCVRITVRLERWQGGFAGVAAASERQNSGSYPQEPCGSPSL